MAYGPSTPYMSLDEWSYGMLHSASAANKCHCNDPQLDKLLEQQRLETNVEKRKQLFQEMQRLAFDQVYYLFAPLGSTYQVNYPYVKNLFPKGTYQTGLRYEMVWLDK